MRFFIVLTSVVYYMISPKPLTPGSTIGLTSTARKITPEELAPALKIIEQWGFKIKLAEDIYAEENQFAGSDIIRISNFQNLLDDDSVDAILCLRGGYGTVRIIDDLDFSKFLINPKWIAGFSDVTVIHSHLHNLSCETLHSTMPVIFNKEGNEKALHSLKSTLLGDPPHYSFSFDSYNKLGRGAGQVIGGNLSILYSLLASPSQIDSNGKILFLEDLDEYLYHIDRMMRALKRSGMLKNLAGLVVGHFSDLNDNVKPFGKSYQEIILEAVEEFNYPVVFGFPAGHEADNRTIIMGRNALLTSNSQTSSLKFELPRNIG